MKTWKAALAHIGVAAAQAAVGLPFLGENSVGKALGNVGIQYGVQFALIALQTVIAKKNSNTDPKGTPLVQNIEGKYISVEQK